MKLLHALKQIARRVRSEAARLSLYARGESKLARALDRRGFALAIEIERHRHEMLGASSTLVDGSLGEGGLYDENISVADACRVSKPRASARYLYSIAAEYRPSTILELGTNVGISSSYLAGAGGKVTSLEASPYRLRLAQRLHQQLGLNNIDYVHGLFTETLDATLRDLPPVELAFIDGHHQYQPTLDYFEAIRRQARPDCVFIFDDIGWSEGMERAWAELKPHFETTAEVGGMGIGFNRPRRTAQ